ncbi:DMT family transporter [Inquilinus sp. Marseille-Q2685]|uniref:DMT family transporter n=1 Tax=Inquilinus sp. Marseille-Q2685 TaxID=2866581 RepID=UPI001CE3BEF8|nr:DMT family transporter [Inquilinus sp. Marseille-Q2685]
MLSSPATKQLPPCSCRPRLTAYHEGFIWGAIAALIWGGFFAYSRLGIDAGFNAADLAFLRYGTAGALMLPWLLRSDIRSLGGVGWLRGASLALLAGPLFVLVSTAGFAFAPLAHGAVIQLGTVTLMGTVLASAFLDERVDIMRAIGLSVIVAGLAITVGPGLFDGGSQAWKGDLLFVGAGLMWALFALLQHRWLVDPMATTAAISVLSLLAYVPGYLLIRGPQALIAAGPLMVIEFAIVLGVFSGIVSLFAFGRAVSCLGAARASLFPALAPGVAILLGVPLAGEIPTLTQLGGVLVLTSGLILSIRQRSARLIPTAEPVSCEAGDPAEYGDEGEGTGHEHGHLGHRSLEPIRCIDAEAEHQSGFSAGATSERVRARGRQKL